MDEVTPHALEQRSTTRLQVFAVVVALLGGVFGIPSAIVQELTGRSDAFIGAPIIEEALKPLGVYLLLIRWPYLLRGQLHTGVLTALAGVTFGLMESLIYVTIYVKDPSPDFVLFRFTVPVAMHTVASFIVGMGLTRALVDWANGLNPLPRRARNCYIGGVALHAAYNITVTILAVAGVLDFD